MSVSRTGRLIELAGDCTQSDRDAPVKSRCPVWNVHCLFRATSLGHSEGLFWSFAYSNIER